MKNNDNFLQNCMIWLTDISMYRCQINQLKKQLHSMKSQIEYEKSSETYTTIIQGIHIALSGLNSTEASILYVIKDNTPSSTVLPFSTKICYEATEDEMFENMKGNYTRFVDLQKSLNNYLKENTAPVTPLEAAKLEKSGKLKLTLKKK